TDPSAESGERHRNYAGESPAPVMREPSVPPIVRPAPLVPSEPPPAIVLAPTSDRPRADTEKELPSLLGARPSMAPSAPAPATRQGASISLVVGIAVLSSIIAAAGVVALQEVFHRRDSRMAEPVQVHAPNVETSHQAARSAPVAEPV